MDNYKLSFLPQFSEDLNRTVEYISIILKNPSAANDLIDSVQDAILERLRSSPESFEPYVSKKHRQNQYYRIYVKNYVIYYVVIRTEEGPVMEVRRLLHNRQHRDDVL